MTNEQTTNDNNRPLHDVGLIIAAAGGSSRFGAGGNKLLRMIEGTPVLGCTLKRFLQIIPPENVVVLAPAAMQDMFRQTLMEAGIPPAVKIAAGGAQRQDSVAKGLQLLPSAVAIVAIQDAARPFTSLDLLRRCIASARRQGSGVAARQVTDTIKVAAADGRVISTPDRSSLRAAETPQVFQRALIEKAYRHLSARGLSVTDDAQAAEIAGIPVFLVEHSEVNSKITFPEDLPTAEQRRKE